MVVSERAFEVGSVVLHNEKGFYTNIRTPLALEVCQESREAVIASYPLSFGSVWFPQRIRFNFATDTIFVNYNTWRSFPLFFSILDLNERSSLRYLSFDFDFSHSWEEHVVDEAGYKDNLIRSIDGLTGLQELLAVDSIDYWLDRHTEDGHPTGGTWEYDHQLQSGHSVFYEGIPEVFAGRTSAVFPLPDSFPTWLTKTKVKSKCSVLGWRKSVRFMESVGEDSP